MSLVLVAASVSAATCRILCDQSLTCSGFVTEATADTLQAPCFACEAGVCSERTDEVEAAQQPKRCNSTGACLVCAGASDSRSTVARAGEGTLSLYMSSSCNFYVPGGVHDVQLTLADHRTIVIYAESATLVGNITTYSPLQLIGPARIHGTVFAYGTTLTMMDVASSTAVGAVVVDTAMPVILINVSGRIYTAALAHARGHVFMTRCTQGKVVIVQEEAGWPAKTQLSATCQANTVNLTALLNVFGRAYEVVFYHGDMVHANADLPLVIAKYAAVVSAALLGLLVLTNLSVLRHLWKMSKFNRKQKIA